MGTIFKFDFRLKQTKMNTLEDGGEVASALVLKSMCSFPSLFYYPELSFYLQEFAFYFPVVPFCFPEVPLYFSKIPYCFAEYLISFLEKSSFYLL